MWGFKMLFLGIDVGTQAAKTIIATEKGKVLAEGRSPIQSLPAELPPGWAVQEAEGWWRAAKEAIHFALGRLGKAGRSPAEIEAAAVDSRH